MEIQTNKDPKATILTVTGRMDAVTAPEYEKQLNVLISNGETNFVIDFNGLEYISSAGLRSLLATAKQLKTKGGQLHFANVVGTVKEVFDISGFGTIFQIHGSVTAALSAVA